MTVHKKLIAVSLLITLLISILALSGCGASVTGIPDSIAELAVLDRLDRNSARTIEYNGYHFTVEHNYDKNTHIDNAVINLAIEYNYGEEHLSLPVWYSYDRASDRWTRERSGSWSDPTCQFYEDKLTGHWQITKYDDVCELEVKSVTQSSITAEYSITAEVYPSFGDYMSQSKMFDLDGNGTFPVDGKDIRIPLELPEGCYSEGYYSDRANLWISLDLQQGFILEGKDRIRYYSY